MTKARKTPDQASAHAVGFRRLDAVALWAPALTAKSNRTNLVVTGESVGMIKVAMESWSHGMDGCLAFSHNSAMQKALAHPRYTPHG